MDRGRQLPAGRPFAASLRRLLVRQAHEVYGKLSRGQSVNLFHWDAPFAEVAEPFLWRYAEGAARKLLLLVRRLRRVAARAGGGVPVAATMGARRQGPTTTLLPGGGGFDFEYVRPRVLQAIRQQAFAFARDVNATSSRRTVTMAEGLRRELLEGIQVGDTQRALAKRVGKIFSDPDRALTIASTESSRAYHLGEYEAYGAVGAWGSEWIARTGMCCELCCRLDGKKVPLGTPFHVHDNGSPHYRIVLHAPAHPRCACSTVAVWATPKE